MSLSEGERNGIFIQTLEPIPSYADVVTAEEWGEEGWDIDGSAYWATDDHESTVSAWTEKPTLATHVTIYNK